MHLEGCRFENCSSPYAEELVAAVIVVRIISFHVAWSSEQDSSIPCVYCCSFYRWRLVCLTGSCTRSSSLPACVLPLFALRWMEPFLTPILKLERALTYY